MSQQAFEIGAWSLACVLAAVMSWQVQKALQASSLQELLFDPRRGEAGVLIRASSWTLAVVIASLVVGGLGARLAGHRLSELALLTWLVRGLARAIAVAGFVYGVIAVCDVTLGEAGPPVVALLLAAGLAWLAWRSRQRRHRIEVLIGYVAVVEAKDSTAGHHLTDVSSRTARIADELNLPARTIDDYGCGALLHDLGKLAVCMHVLTKPTNLDPEEQAQMRAHTTIGRDLLSVLPGFATAAAIAGHNHERWDGQGYPDALAGSIFHFPRGSWPSWTPSTR